MAGVGREENTGNVRSVGSELRHWDQAGDIANCDEAPYVDGSVDTVADCCAKKRAVSRYRHGGHTFVFLRHELMAALILPKVPDADIAASIAGNELALVRVNNHIVNCDAVGVIALDVTAAGIPDFDGSCNSV